MARRIKTGLKGKPPTMRRLSRSYVGVHGWRGALRERLRQLQLMQLRKTWKAHVNADR